MRDPELRKLDEERWDNPRKVKKKLGRMLRTRDYPRESLAELLMVYGSACRQLDHLTDARWAFFVGETRALETVDRRTLAEIYQRSAKIEFLDGEFVGALGLLRKAAGTFSELGDQNSEARVLVDLASSYVARGMLAEGECCGESALAKLNEDEYWNRFTAHQVLAVCLKPRSPAASLAQLDSAKALLEHSPRGAMIRFIWLEVKIKADLLPKAEVAAALEAAAWFFIETEEVLNAALAALEFARCWPERASKGLREIAFALAKNVGGKLAATAVMEVYRAAAAGADTEAVLDAATRKINEAISSAAPTKP